MMPVPKIRLIRDLRDFRNLVNDEMSVDTFDKLMESKPVKERRAELDRKLDVLKRKYVMVSLSSD